MCSLQETECKGNQVKQMQQKHLANAGFWNLPKWNFIKDKIVEPGNLAGSIGMHVIELLLTNAMLPRHIAVMLLFGTVC